MREPPQTWMQRNGPFITKYGLTAISTGVPWWLRLWFTITNPFTYVLFGYMRW